MPNRVIAPSSTFARQPIIVLGDSNMCGGYEHSTAYPAYLQNKQTNANWYYNIFCHQGTLGASEATSGGAIVALGPFATVNPGARGSWMSNLGWRLSQIGMSPTLINVGWGGNTLDMYNATITGNAYNADITGHSAGTNRLANIKAALALLKAPKKPILLCGPPTNGGGTDTNWATAYGRIVAQLQTDLGYAALKSVIIQNCSSWNQAALASSQQSYVNANPTTSVLIPINDAVFELDSGEPVAETGGAIHWNIATGDLLASRVAPAIKAFT